MSRRYEDALGNVWTVSLEVADHPIDTVEEEAFFHFVAEAEDTDDRQIRSVGPAEDTFDTLPSEDLQLALEAAGNEQGFLFVHPDGHLWWVRSAEEDPLAEGTHITFSDVENEFAYAGALSGPPETLSEDELLEVLDQARGVASP